LTKETAVKTFARAKAIATEYPTITRIYIADTVPIEGETSLAGSQAILIRDPSFKGILLSVPKGGNATLRDILVDGNIQTEALKGSLVEVQGTLTITDGASLQNNHLGTIDYRSTGGAVRIIGGSVIMTGGEILNNSGTKGGGVFLKSGGKFDMSGGVIHYNRTINGPDMQQFNDAGSGGGVCLEDGATFNMSGNARIQWNKSDEVGGGVSVGSLEVSLGSNRFNMTGGMIEGNTARATGGGIFIQAGYKSYVSTAKITAGSIINNKMLGTGRTNYAFGGGGIYVNGYAPNYGFKDGELYLENVIVTDNNAAHVGGGLAACPVSDTRIYLTDGGAIFDNTGANNLDDLYILSARIGWGFHGGNPEYKISPVMLGGQPYRWHHVKDGTEVPLHELSGTLTGEGKYLHYYAGEKADDQANALAKVFITGNTSRTRGGGIGSNGTVVIGRPDETIDIQVEKKWTSSTEDETLRPEQIEVELWYQVAGSSEEKRLMCSERIVPDADGNWHITFKALPKYDSEGNLLEYSVTERPVAGYVSQVTGDQETGFTITNSPIKKIEIPVQKVWVDSDDQEGLRPESVTIRLLADGEVTGQELILSAANNWFGTFKDLDEYKDGNIIIYSVEEASVEGYETSITGEVASGFIVTNKREPDNPDEPDIPDEPDKPIKPDKPRPRLPKTGAASFIGLVGGLLFITASALVGIKRIEDKDKRE